MCLYRGPMARTRRVGVGEVRRMRLQGAGWVGEALLNFGRSGFGDEMEGWRWW